MYPKCLIDSERICIIQNIYYRPLAMFHYSGFSVCGNSSMEPGLENRDGKNRENSKNIRANEDKACSFKSENEEFIHKNDFAVKEGTSSTKEKSDETKDG